MTKSCSKAKRKKALLNILLIALLIGMVAWPLLSLQDAEFGGTDNIAAAEIKNINENYSPWFHSIFQPSSSEIESMLFALQSALGAGLLGYGLGYLKGKSRQEEDE